MLWGHCPSTIAIHVCCHFTLSFCDQDLISSMTLFCHFLSFGSEHEESHTWHEENWLVFPMTCATSLPWCFVQQSLTSRFQTVHPVWGKGDCHSLGINDDTQVLHLSWGLEHWLGGVNCKAQVPKHQDRVPCVSYAPPLWVYQQQRVI